MAFFVAPLIFLLHVSENWIPNAGWALLAAWATWALVPFVRGARAWLAGNQFGAPGW